MISQYLNSFVLGLLTPLGAVCVLPLYPAFLSFLANRLTPQTQKSRNSRTTYALLGMMVSLGSVMFMLLLGLIFSALLQVSLTSVTQIVSPIAFSILGIVSLAMIFDFKLPSLSRRLRLPRTRSALADAFFYGFFFGAIVLPCNPGFIALFLARVSLLTNPLASLTHFFLFGVGIGFPLVAFSTLSSTYSTQIISFLSRYRRQVNFIAGLAMLAISLYYLIFVFRVFG
ncbi:cytochrome C biogenesis protein [Candidatus Pacearchaeota archaeon]|nr:MAG: cytochrome C biogenesis protein [Candidatus Pacearchaeota archaeon]